MKKYPSLKPAIWGAVVGAAAISVIGFSSFGWTLGSTAERMAKEQAQNAVVAVLAPICVEKFQHQADAATKLIEFKKVSSSWDRRSIIEKGGWAAVAGIDAPSSAVLPLVQIDWAALSSVYVSLCFAATTISVRERSWRYPFDFRCCTLM